MTEEEQEIEEDIQEAQQQANNLKENIEEKDYDFSDLSPKSKKFLKGLFTFIFIAGTFIVVMIGCLIAGRIDAAQEICENLEMIPVKDPLLNGELNCVHEDRFFVYKPESESLPFEMNWSNFT